MKIEKKKEGDLTYEVLKICDLYDDAAKQNVKDCEIIEFINYPGVTFMIFDKVDVLVKNRFNSGQECILTPIQVAVYDMLIGCELLMHLSGDYERIYRISKAIFRNWDKEYLILVDKII